MKRIALVGNGVTGKRIAKRLDLIAPDCDVVAVDPRGTLAEAADCNVAVVANGGPQIGPAAKLLAHGVSVVCTSDDLGDVRALSELHEPAVQHGASVVVGAGMSPGLTGLLARYLVEQLHHCDEIHLAVHGTAGPACARQHHKALAGRAVGVHNGLQIERPAGSGRELCWFPEPVGAYDCYRGELASPMLLHELFPNVHRISARVSANRRDRFTARLPMLSPPHREGGVGAVRVEVRGANSSGERLTLVAGVAELVGTCAAATAAAFTGAIVRGDLDPGITVAGDERLNTIGLLREVERLGVRLQEFTGIPHAVNPASASTQTMMNGPRHG